MKKLLFFVALTLFSVTQVLGQQKIKDGTVTGQNLPNKDALLELESLNKGLLHVRLELKELSDPSPLSVHTAGMMVYNTAQTADVQPGIYYNDGTQWVRLGSSGEHSDIVTTLKDNEDGTYTYTSEDGTVTVIDVPADVIENFQTIINDNGVKNAITNLIEQSGGNVYYDGDTFTYIDGSGDVNQISFEEIVKAYETITTIEDNGDGTFTYTNEAGDTFVIDIPASVVENFENIINEGPVTINGDTFNTIEEYLTHIANGSVTAEGSDFIDVSGAGTDSDPYIVSIIEGNANSLLITNAAGDLEWVTIEDIVQANETLTTIEDNGDGTFTYTNENGVPVTFDANTLNLIDNGDGSYTFTDVNGHSTVINSLVDIVNNFEEFVTNNPVTVGGDTYNSIEEYFNTLIESNETVTTLVDNGDGTYTYTNESGDKVTIDIPSEVINNFEQIVKEEVEVDGRTFQTVEEYITYLTESTGGFTKIVYDQSTGDVIFQEWDEVSNTWVNVDNSKFETIVKSNETITTVTDNGNGTYTYTNEAGDTFVIDVPASVVENFETIVNDGPVTINGDTFNTVEEYLTHVANESVTLEGSDFIDVSGTGTDSDPYIVSIIEGAANTMLITDDNGDLVWATIEDIVAANETVTDIVDNGNGTYTYTNEAGDTFVIDVPSSVVENFETIVNDGPVTINGDTFNTVEEYLTHVANESVSLEGSDFIDVSGDGTDGNPYIVSIIEGDPNSMLITDNNGDLVWATIEDIVAANETVTDIVDNGNGTYTYTNEDGDTFVIDVPSSVVENFETIVNDGPVTINGDTFNTVEEYLTHVANESVTIDGSPFVEVTGTGTAADPYVVSIIEGAANSMLITNAAGDLEWATIEDIVQGNETLTVLTDNGNGTFTYTDEEGDDVTFDATRSAIVDNGNGTYTVKDADGNDVIIDIPGDIVNNFETIVQSGPVTVNNETYSTVEEYFTDLIDNNETLTELEYDAATNQLNFKDENGTIHNIQLNNTSLTYDDTDQELVYVDNEGNTTTIDLNDLVNSNINTGSLTTHADGRITIADGTDALLHDVQIDVNEGNLRLQNIGGTLQVSQIENGTGGQILVTNEGGNGVTWADPLAIAKGNLTSNDIEVTDGANSILRDVSLEIKDGVITTDKIADGAVTADKLDGGQGDDGRVGVADAQGNITYVTLDEVVKANETITKLVVNTDGTFTYYNENEIDENGDPLAGVTGVTIDPYLVSVEDNSATDGEYVFKDASGATLATININSDNILYDNSDSGLNAENVKDALDELANIIETNQGDLTLGSAIEFTGGTDGDKKLLADASIDVKEGGITTDKIADDAVTTEKLDDKAVTSDKLDGGAGEDGRVGVADAQGNITYVTLDEVVKDNETITKLVVNTDGTFTYYNEDEIDENGDPLASATGVTIDPYLVNVEDNSATDGEYVFKDASGATLATININSDNILYDNSNSNLNSDNVKDALDELANIIETNQGDLILGSAIEFTGGTDGDKKLLADASIDVKDGGITTDKIANGAVTNDKVGADAITSDKIKDGEVKAEDLGADPADEGKVGVVQPDGTVVYQNISSDNVDGKDLTAADGSIVVTDGDGATLVDANVKVADGGITNDKIADDAVSTDKIADGAVTNDKVGADAITSDKIKDGEVKAEDLGADPADEGKVGVVQPDGTVVYQNISSDNVDGKDLTAADGSIVVTDGDGATLVDANVKVADGGITNDKIADDAVTTEKLDDKAVTSDKLDGGAGEDGRVGVADANGNITYVTLDEVVKDNETITILKDNEDGTFTYYNEKDIDEDGNPIAGAEGVSFDVTQSDNGNPNDNNTTGKAGDVYVDETTGDIYTHNGTEWVKVGDHIKTGEGNPNDNSTAGKEGDIYIDNSTGDTYVYNETTQEWEIQGKDLIAWGYDADPTEDESTIEIVTGGEKALLVETSIRVKEESITTDHIKDGTIKPEDIAQAGGNQILVTDDEGNPEWKDADKVTPRFFYMPAVIFDTEANGTATRDLYQEYKDQFTGQQLDIAHGVNGSSMSYTGGLVGSAGAPQQIHVFEDDELYYYVTYYDQDVFENLSISADGKLTYTVKDNSQPHSYMNIVFVIK